MARSRNIKPGFFKNETLAELPPLARLLFAGLWCLADREGRLEDRPKRIRAELLPYDDGSVNDLLQALHDAGFILRYKIDGDRFIQVQNFSKHQNPHCKESASAIPAPDKHGASTVLAPDKHRTGPADSLNLIPDFLNPITTSPDKPVRFDARAHLLGMGVTPTVVDDWLDLRKKKRAPATATAIKEIESEAGKAGVSLEHALRECCSRGWTGFKAGWYSGKSNHSQPSPDDLADKDYGKGGAL